MDGVAFHCCGIQMPLEADNFRLESAARFMTWLAWAPGRGIAGCVLGSSCGMWEVDTSKGDCLMKAGGRVESMLTKSVEAPQEPNTEESYRLRYLEPSEYPLWDALVDKSPQGANPG